MTDVKRQIELLRGAQDTESVERALKAIDPTAVTVHEATLLLRAATESFPPSRFAALMDVPGNMVMKVRDAVSEIGADADLLPPVIAEIFKGLTPKARWMALQVLTNVCSESAVQAYLSILRAHGNELEDGIWSFQASPGLHRSRTRQLTPQTARLLFPNLLTIVQRTDQLWSSYGMLLECLRAELIDASAFAQSVDLITQHLATALAGIREHQGGSTQGGHNWKYTSPYADYRDYTGVLLDTCGHLDMPPLNELMATADDLADPYLRLNRATSLLRAGDRVSNDELKWIAQAPRERYWLRDKLSGLNRDELLPESCFDQTKLAEGNMVDWLCFGTELGREPDEIEQVHVETRRVGGRLLKRGAKTDYYFFRFRVTEEHWSKENGWMVGMAGGYARVPRGTLESGGSTFSKFKEWDGKPLKEHVKDYLS